uniref:Prolactin receptor n=1 Tax=Gouania willdenowi TaxID=441366 RepID=A0A8C5GAH7_GOUWI
MKRGEKSDGHRQMRPITFPASNYSGNSQQMLQEIRNSLRNLSKPSDPPKVDIGVPAKMHPEDSRQQGRSSQPKNPHHKTLQEIRKSLLPFANEPLSSSPVNQHKAMEPPSACFDESFKRSAPRRTPNTTGVNYWTADSGEIPDRCRGAAETYPVETPGYS